MNIIPVSTDKKFSNESEVEVYATSQLNTAGYDLTMRRCKSVLLKKHWPSKTKTAKGAGYPDLLLHVGGMDKPVCVWENKGPGESALTALAEAQFYIEGLRKALPNEPGLPLIAAGYNGKELLSSIYRNDGSWTSIKVDGAALTGSFPTASFVMSGIDANGVFTASQGSATARELRGLLVKLKTLYRNIASLSSGRAPIDFTVAMLTLKLVIEQTPDWGRWSEIPRFGAGSPSEDHAIAERLDVLGKRVLSDKSLHAKYADIFKFHEKSESLEVAFSFLEVLETVEKGKNNFVRLFVLLDQMAPLSGADFDIFGEVYQAIGDEATKKKLGEFFTGRHIISGVLPVLFSRSGFDKSFQSVEHKTIADIACGTGGFLTETLRLVRRMHNPAAPSLKNFAKNSFFGYDLGHANASRARVNMYFAGDGFSKIEGGVDTLSSQTVSDMPPTGFDVIMTNPPYGKSNYGRIEEAFLLHSLDLLEPGTGWLLIVLPVGVLENPRARSSRFALLNRAVITDVISLPKHAFAPYTQQRTAVVIAQKRPKPLVPEGDEWESLLKATSHEKVSMFIVDNDGFANSDKRYPTSKSSPTGEWLHNDLAPWTDADGVKTPSKLYQAMIYGKVPSNEGNEFGIHLGLNYGVFTTAQLAHGERGIALLPDIPLRDEPKSIPLDEWLSRVDQVDLYAQGKVSALPFEFSKEISFLMNQSLEIPKASLSTPASVKKLFDVAKGDQGLTEAMIYRGFSPSGLPVYGGGSGIPRFRAEKPLLRNSGDEAAVFSGPAIVVSMDGSSGSIQVVEEGEFFCNHHGAVLNPLEDDINLWCFAQIAEHALRRFASNKTGSATLTRPALEGLKVRLPTGQAALDIEARRRTLTRLSRLM